MGTLHNRTRPILFDPADGNLRIRSIYVDHVCTGNPSECMRECCLLMEIWILWDAEELIWTCWYELVLYYGEVLDVICWSFFAAVLHSHKLLLYDYQHSSHWLAIPKHLLTYPICTSERWAHESYSAIASCQQSNGLHIHHHQPNWLLLFQQLLELPWIFRGRETFIYSIYISRTKPRHVHESRGHFVIADSGPSGSGHVATAI